MMIEMTPEDERRMTDAARTAVKKVVEEHHGDLIQDTIHELVVAAVVASLSALFNDGVP